MRSFRYMAFGLGIMAAAMLLIAAPSAFAKEGRDGAPYNVNAYTLDIGYLGDHFGALSAFVRPADHSAMTVSYSTDGGTVLIDKASAPAPYAQAILATTQAGWRSGRLRKLSVG